MIYVYISPDEPLCFILASALQAHQPDHLVFAGGICTDGHQSPRTWLQMQVSDMSVCCMHMAIRECASC